MSMLYNRWRRRQSGGALATLDLSTGGTFTRASDGYAQTAALGTASGLTLFSSGTRRVANLGDGDGPGYFCEGSRTNEFWHSRDLSNGYWNTGGGTFTVNAVTGVDAIATIAGQHNNAATNIGKYRIITPGSSIFLSFSAYVRAVSGVTPVAYQFTGVHSLGSLVEPVLTTLAAGGPFQRVVCNSLAHSSGNAGCFWVDCSNQAADGGQAATAQDVYLDLPQGEIGAFSSSPIVTVAGTGTRAADLLSYATGDFPAAFLSNGLVFEYAPECSSAEFVAAGVSQYLACVQNTDHFLALIVSGGAAYLLLEIGGTDIAEVGPITWSRDQKLTFTAKPSAGSVTVAGATTGDGTDAPGGGSAWPSGQTLHIGSDNSGNGNAFGRFLGGTGGLITEAA